MILWQIFIMKKKFYRSKKPTPPVRKKQASFRMKPGSDKSLHQVFKKIGMPEQRPFKPDPFQLEALEAIQYTDCLVTAPTGAGKTWIAQEAARLVFNANGHV